MAGVGWFDCGWIMPFLIIWGVVALFRKCKFLADHPEIKLQEPPMVIGTRDSDDGVA